MKQLLVLIVPILFGMPESGCESTHTKGQPLFPEMTRAIESNSYKNIHSVVVAKGDSIIYEHYFNNYNRDSLHDSRSSFKSITSLFTGIAIDKGFIKTTGMNVLDFFPEYAPFKNDDQRKHAITIQNLLNMQSGFDCDEFFGNGKDCEADMSTTNNWVKFSLDLPMKEEPGTHFAYTSANPVILGDIISKTSHLSIMDFAKKYLFDLMDIRQYHWTVDPTGHATTAGSFFMRPVDMIKIGQMVRDRGKWKGQQIVSEQWINTSTTAPILIPNFSFAKISRSNKLVPQPAYYGDYWYREKLKTQDYEENLLFASGNGGQYIFIIERLNLVVVFTQGNYDSWRAKSAFEILAQYILPSFEK